MHQVVVTCYDIQLYQIYVTLSKIRIMVVVEHFISLDKALGFILRTRSLQKYRETQSATKS